MFLPYSLSKGLGPEQESTAVTSLSDVKHLNVVLLCCLKAYNFIFTKYVGNNYGRIYELNSAGNACIRG